MREEGGPLGLLCFIREKEKETGVVAWSLRAFPSPVLPGTCELGALCINRLPGIPSFSRELVKIGPRQRIWKWKGLGASESGSGD